MRRRGLVLAAVLLLASVASAHARPRVGLALSGGGAKGFAHIGVIQVLEENGIPVDCVAGTSMGSIVGALYAIGYPVEEIERIALETDWPDLFSDAIPRRDRAIEQKAMEDRYLLALPIVEGSIGLPRGLIAGQKISRLLDRLTVPVHDLTDFGAFPRPFRCVATDIVAGEAVVLDRGFLPEAVRASMAIPSIFTPVEIDGRLLVDGMLVRNLPVEDAFAMGADVVIGVDVGAPPAERKDLESFVSILTQAMGLLGAASTAHQRELCNVLVTPDIADVSVMDFDRMEEIIASGRAAAEAVLPELLGLVAAAERGGEIADLHAPSRRAVFRLDGIVLEDLTGVEHRVAEASFGLQDGDSVSIDDVERAVQRVYSTGFFERVTYRIEAVPDGCRLRIFALEKTVDFFRFGLRYDSYDELAAIFNLLFRNKLGRGSILNIDAVIGARNHFTLSHITHPGLYRRLALLSRLGYMDEYIDVFAGRNPVFRIDVKAAYGEFLVGNTFSNRLAFGAGVRGEIAGVDAGYTLWEVPRFDENLFALAGALWWDSLDRTHFPTSGVSFYTRHEFSERTWGSNTSFSRHYADLKAFVPLHRRVTFLGHLVAGTLTGEEPPIHYAFFLGGLDLPVLLLERQLTRVSFLGLRGRQMAGRHVQFAQVGFQFEASRRLLFILRANAGTAYDAERFDIQGQRYENGAGLTLGLRTPLGPLEITGAYGSREEYIGHLSMGMKF